MLRIGRRFWPFKENGRFPFPLIVALLIVDILALEASYGWFTSQAWVELWGGKQGLSQEIFVALLLAAFSSLSAWYFRDQTSDLISRIVSRRSMSPMTGLVTILWAAWIIGVISYNVYFGPEKMQSTWKAGHPGQVNSLAMFFAPFWFYLPNSLVNLGLFVPWGLMTLYCGLTHYRDWSVHTLQKLRLTAAGLDKTLGNSTGERTLVGNRIQEFLIERRRFFVEGEIKMHPFIWCSLWFLFVAFVVVVLPGPRQLYQIRAEDTFKTISWVLVVCPPLIVLGIGLWKQKEAYDLGRTKLLDWSKKVSPEAAAQLIAASEHEEDRGSLWNFVVQLGRSSPVLGYIAASIILPSITLLLKHCATISLLFPSFTWSFLNALFDCR